jgi:uncharacterized protein YhhL (DUF1145 family)
MVAMMMMVIIIIIVIIVRSCWTTLKKKEDTGSWRRKLRIALFGELGLEEATDLSQDRLLRILLDIIY